MRKRILKSTLVTFFTFSSLGMIQPKAYAQDLENAIVMTTSEMEVCALFARLLEDIHMYALMKTNPLANATMQNSYINALENDGLKTLPPMISTILLEKIPPNPAINYETLLSDNIQSFFQNGLTYVDASVMNPPLDPVELLLVKDAWNAAGNAIILALTHTITKNTTYEGLLTSILNQIVSGRLQAGNSYASDQVARYAQHTSDGYEFGL